MSTFYELKTPTEHNEVHNVSLAGVSYVFTWLWNERDSHWFLNIELFDGTPIAHGIKVVLGADLLESVAHLEKPQGELHFFDLTTDDNTVSGEDPGLDDFGSRVVGVFVTP